MNYMTAEQSIKWINKNIFDLKTRHNTYLIVGLIILIFFILLLIIVIVVVSSYYVIKFLEINIINDLYFCNYTYNKKTNDLLEKYGNCKINKIYLVKNPITDFTIFILNVITLYKFQKTIEKYNEENNTNIYPYHVSLLVEINLPNKIKKIVLIEKSNCINVTENIYLHEKKILKIIKLPKQKYTINDILQETKKRIGDKQFFNWTIYKNNCYVFIKEILKTIGMLNKTNIKFINQDQLIKPLNFSDFTLHTIHFFCSLNNIFDNYILS